jgi:hypothetical protein
MRLSCQKAFLLLLVATIGCRDTTAPLKLPAQFELVNINGRPVPTFFSPTPGLTPTILSASLTLYEAGQAVMTEHRREFDGTETTRTANLVYRIRGNQLVLSCFQPPAISSPIDLLCVSYTGTISVESLSLIIVPGAIDGIVVYNYRPALTL